MINTNILNTKILLSGATIVAAAALIIGATYAFFSDTETSTDNVLVAGQLDLKVANTSYAFDYNVESIVNPTGVFGQVAHTTWTNEDPIGKFFDFVDLKPGDYGEDTISLTVEDNDAWICAATQITEGADSDLADEVNFAFWNDDGDNVYEGDSAEVDEVIFLQGPASALDGGAGQIALADSTTNIWADGAPNTPVIGASTNNIGKIWCYGTLVPSPLTAGNHTPEAGATGFTCDGSLIDDGQLQTLMGDIQFYAVQARNNASFTCANDYTPEWPDGGTGGPEVGSVLSAYTPPTGDDCDVIVEDTETIQDGVDEADPGETVCVENGTYVENVTISTNNVTLAGDGASATSTINGRVKIDATGVTVKGFNILGANVSGEGVNGVYVVGGSDNLTISDNLIDGDGHASGQRIGVHFAAGGTTDVTVENNVIRNWDSTGLYLNPTAGPVSIMFNDFLTNNVGIGSSSINNVTITNNDFVGNIAEAMGMDSTAGSVSGIEIHVNNFTPAGVGNNVNSYGSTPADATNNWWDNEDAGDRTNDQPDINVTSPAGSAFDHQ